MISGVSSGEVGTEDNEGPEDFVVVANTEGSGTIRAKADGIVELRATEEAITMGSKLCAEGAAESAVLAAVIVDGDPKLHVPDI